MARGPSRGAPVRSAPPDCSLPWSLHCLPIQPTPQIFIALKALVRHHIQDHEAGPAKPGATRPIFSAEALTLIAQVTQGLPRSINNLATGSLSAGHLEQKPMVDQQTVRSAVADFGDVVT